MAEQKKEKHDEREELQHRIDTDVGKTRSLLVW
jgi:hypothetical protein